jgi:proteasome lid subunit RPN8/RPN11
MAPARRLVEETSERPNPVGDVHFWQSPPGSAVDIMLVTHLNVYADIHDHAYGSLPNETGGFLLGRVGFDLRRGSWHVEIDECVRVDPLDQDPAHFSFTWRDVDRVRRHREEQGKALIGWYHTHPDLGIFLSETDLEKSHRVLFAEPFQVALVYDPVRGRAGYFFWEGRQIIDASQAAWREFEIMASEEPPTDERAEPSPAPAEPVAQVAEPAPTPAPRQAESID